MTEMADIGAVVAVILLGLVGIAFYFLPTIIAGLRDHRNGLPIFILNLCLGWSVLGWVVALVWAFTHQPPSSPQLDHPQPRGDTRPGRQRASD